MENEDEKKEVPPAAAAKPGAVSVSGAAPRGKGAKVSRKIGATVSSTGEVESMKTTNPSTTLGPGEVEVAEKEEDISHLHNSANIEPLEPEHLAGASSKPAPSDEATSEPASASAAPTRARASRRADAKAAIREEMTVLRGDGQSQGPGAVSVTGSVAAGTAQVSSVNGDSVAAAAPTSSMSTKAAIKQEMQASRENPEMNKPGAHSVASSASSGKGGGSRVDRPSRRTNKASSSVSEDDSKSTATATTAPVSGKPGATLGTSASEKSKSGASPGDKAGAVSSTGSDKSKIIKGVDVGLVMESKERSSRKLESDLKVLGAGAETALPEQSSIKSLKEKSSTELGVQPSSTQLLAEGDEGVISAQIIDEEELEAQYQEKLMKNVVAAEVVDENEFKETGRCWKMSCCCILIVAIVCAIAIPLSKKDEIPNDPPTASPTEQDEYDYLYDLVQVFSGDALDDNSTAQYQALQWLAYEDPAGLPIKESNASTLIERYAAAVLYYSTQGDLWSSDLNFLSNSSLCDWNDGEFGLTCEDTSDFVKQVYIDNNNLNGTLPSEFVAFTRMSVLSFNVDFLRGTVPAEIGEMSALTFLQVGEQLLTGTLPPSLENLDLDVLNFYKNQLSGTIPRDMFFGNDNMRFLIVAENNFEGSLPELDRESAILYAFFDQNRFEGTIPQGYMEQKSMVYLSLPDNLLTGTIPQQIVGLKNLEAFYASKNSFSGTIPTGFSQLRNLAEILLDDNNFNGTIPSQLGQMEVLASLDISANRFTGPLPSELSNIETLVTLDVSYTDVSGTVPVSFSRLSSLSSFDLISTNIVAGLDAAFCNQPVLSTSIRADCGPGNATIPCDCCTTCCVDGEDCEVNVASVCEARRSEFELAPDRGTTCECTEDGLRMSCNDTMCESCNVDKSICAVNTDYGYTFDENTGERTSFHSTIQYTTGRDETLVFTKDASESSICDLEVNGEKCQFCGIILCASSAQGYSIECRNLNGGPDLNTCFPKKDAGYLEVFYMTDPSLLSGCSPMLINYQSQDTEA